MKKLALIFLILLLFIGCTPKALNTETVVNEAKQITLADFLDKVDNDETFAVIFILDGCVWCEAAFPVFKDVTTKNLDKTYYINFTDAQNETNYQENFSSLELYLTDYLTIEDGEAVFYIPHAFFIKDGKVVSDHVGTVSSHDANSAPMTDTQTAELSGYYQDGFDAIQ